ncbi:hypothetical protein LCGC14_2233960, partial [marine sediment metagenome]
MYCGDLEANTITTITIGPMLDKDDADTEKTGLSITAASVFASKNGGAKAQVNDGSGCSEDAHGIYRKQINATDTNTEGLLTIYVHFADCLYIRQDYTVLSQAAYASKYTEKDSGLMSVDAVAISGDTTSADNLELQYDTTGLAGDTFPDGNEAYNIDFWTYHYYDGDLGTPAWVEVHGATQISNSQYNDVATGLANFTANRYGVSWVFM